MTAHELRDALDELGLSQAALAEAIDVHSGTVARWVSGEIPVPGPVAVVVQFMQAHAHLASYSTRRRRKG